MSEQKSRPILFSAPMIRALLAGKKTQTPRIIKPQPPRSLFHLECLPSGEWRDEEVSLGMCPYGQPGDRLYCKETWATSHRWDGIKPSELPGKPTEESSGVDIYYRATDDSPQLTNRDGGIVQNWRPSIFMPRWASRITLEIESVRVGRLCDISEEDAKSEGVESPSADREEQDWKICPQCGGTGLYTSFGANLGACFDTDCSECDTHKKRYRHLWESINGEGSWAKNCWVWIVAFKRIAP